jgi:hypothetical protein
MEDMIINVTTLPKSINSEDIDVFMTIDEIHEKYDGEWIYAIDCLEDDTGTILGGKVVLHSQNRDNVVRAMNDYEKMIDTLTYFRYAGRIPDEISILL